MNPEDITIEIKGMIVPIACVWAHLRSGDVPTSKIFILTIPAAFVSDVFDPNCGCPKGRPIEIYIRELISEFGTFIMEGFLKNIRRLQNAGCSPYRWVIAKVDEIEMSGDGILIRGKVVPFQGSSDPAIILKRLE
jgi:hypothetical protein